MTDSIKTGDATPMTLATFKAGAKRKEWKGIDWNSAEPEWADAENYYDGIVELPAALWVYPGGCWIVEVTEYVFQLFIDGHTVDGDKARLEGLLHTWAVDTWGISEPGVSS